MQIFQHDGNAVFEGVWTSITAAKGFDTTLLNIPKDATHFVRYTTGATAALSVGETLTGGTSSSTCVLVAQAVEVGTAGSSDTGVIFVKSPSAAFTTTGETLTGGTSTGTVAIIQDFISINPGRPHPKALLITAEVADIRCTISGIKATTTATQSYGFLITNGQSWVVRGLTNIRNFKTINAVASNGAILHYALYY